MRKWSPKVDKRQVAPELGSVSSDKIVISTDIKKIPGDQLAKMCKTLRNEDKMVAQWCLMEAMCTLKDAKIVSIIILLHSILIWTAYICSSAVQQSFINYSRFTFS